MLSCALIWINNAAIPTRARETHYLNAVPIHEIADCWIGKYERVRLQAPGDLKRNLEGKMIEP